MKLKFIDFFSYRKWGFFVSTILTVATIIGYYTFGLNLGIDFRGGIVIEVRPNNEVLAQKSKATLLERHNDILFQSSGDNMILRFQNAANDTKAVDAIRAEILAIDEEAQFIKVDYVGPKVSQDLIKKAVLCFFWTLFAVTLYILLRFNWKFSLGAILSLCHDLVVSIGFFVFTRYEFDLTSIAAILTVIGYSVNDSVVIFDRIRENANGKQKYDIDAKTINQSLNETLSRTIMTFLTTFVACVALWLFGGDNLKSFSAVITFGVAFGTYSSIFVSANILPYLNKKYEFKRDS
ncbi:Protein-export membrane protein SecF [Candidatus Bandiella woodruffii]|uniref:Protein-export membrane protein SecF n=2 Tax=Candidatus Bandiella euplotis TaxID=1664265 RepID=A0ABZ0UPY7_9RICK|nr:Protein-export membrane protein SecF [Candidatus Bandiella woodruffii]